MLIGFIYIRGVNVSDGVWVVMTCAIVLFDNSTVGGALKKGYYRILGTIAASIFSILVIVLFSNSTIANLIAIVIAGFVAAYYFMDTEKSYVGGMITWTTPIMLINNHNLVTIFTRPLNIMVGIIISYLVQRYFYPEYGKNLVLGAFSNLINKEKLLLADVAKEKQVTTSLHRLVEKNEVDLIAIINKTTKLIADSKSEPPMVNKYGEICTAMVIHLRRVLKFITVMIYHIEDETLTLNHSLLQVIDKIIVLLGYLADNIKAIEVNGNYDKLKLNTLLLELKEKYLKNNHDSHIMIPRIIIKELDLFYDLLDELIQMRKEYKIR
jgi:uncharacterized membrane protein YgaE (UPF0421/DUF939 family)